MSLYGDAYRDMMARGRGSMAAEHAALVSERAETVRMLRMLCNEYGDNDWPDDLHLADVIDKHLMKYWPEEGGL